MPRTLFFFAVVAAVAVPAASEAEPATAGLRLGVDFGTRGEGDNELGPRFKRGWVVGFGGAYAVSPHVAVELGAMYMEKGYRYDPVTVQPPGGPGPLTDVELRTDLGYLEIPLHVVARLPLSETLTARVLAGPSLGILLSAETVVLTPPGASLDVTDDGDTVDWSASVGAGLDWDLGNAHLVFDVSYCHGLTDVEFVSSSPALPAESVSYLSVTNRTIVLTTELRFLTFEK